MKQKSLTVHARTAEGPILEACEFGFVYMLMRRSELHKTYPLAYIEQLIEPALKHKCLKFYFDEHGSPVGYAIWATVADDVEERFMRSGRWQLHSSEWNEGATLWLVDFVAPFGHARTMLDDLARLLSSEHSVLRYFRVRRNRLRFGEAKLARLMRCPAENQSVA